jgi:DNA-binding beta-propeller fold protein YncE
MNFKMIRLAPISILFSGLALASGDPMGTATVDDLVQQGKDFYNLPVSCWVCHGEKGEGRVGPELSGPSAGFIYEQIQNNPQMGFIDQELKPTDDDLVGVSLYLRTLAGQPVDQSVVGELYAELAEQKAALGEEAVYPKSKRDLAVEKIETFDTVLADWSRKAQTGNIWKQYQTRVLRTFEPGEPAFTPEPGKTYFYENVGYGSNPDVLHEGYKSPPSTQVVVGDAETREVIASGMMPPELRSAVHTTAVSADGRFAYIVAAKEGGGDLSSGPRSPATVLKVDAVTLQPIKQFTIGGRLHHGQVFRDKYLLIDTFSRDPDGLDIMLLDTDTDEVVGGIRNEELGGASYTAWTDDKFIYVLMEPMGYGPRKGTGMSAIRNMYAGKLVAMRPFWVARINPDTWEVEQEYPYPGFRGNWITIDSKSEFMYVPGAGSSNISKINIETGEIAWTKGTGIGPYGSNLNADGTEIWIADKGEGTGHFGRKLTVLDAQPGQIKDTVFSGYQVDHVLLSPDGKQMWATSNGEGRIFVFDAESHERLDVIDMPLLGDPHGLAWVHYDKDGNSATIRDQGGFHNGARPGHVPESFSDSDSNGH